MLLLKLLGVLLFFHAPRGRHLGLPFGPTVGAKMFRYKLGDRKVKPWWRRLLSFCLLLLDLNRTLYVDFDRPVIFKSWPEGGGTWKGALTPKLGVYDRFSVGENSILYGRRLMMYDSKECAKELWVERIWSVNNSYLVWSPQAFIYRLWMNKI